MSLFVRSGFFVVPLFVLFWLRILKIFITKIIWNPRAERDKGGTKKEAATITFELINSYINSWRFGLLKVHVIYQKKSCTDGGNPTKKINFWVTSHFKGARKKKEFILIWGTMWIWTTLINHRTSFMTHDDLWKGGRVAFTT